MLNNISKINILSKWMKLQDQQDKIHWHPLVGSSIHWKWLLISSVPPRLEIPLLSLTGQHQHQCCVKLWVGGEAYIIKYYLVQIFLLRMAHGMADPIILFSSTFVCKWIVVLMTWLSSGEVSERFLPSHASSGHWHWTYGCVAGRG